MGWDGYVNVRGNRYSVPSGLVGQSVVVRIGLDERLRIYHAEQLVASHALRSIQEGWSSIAEHQAALWQDTLKVEERPLEAYEDVVAWS